MKRDYGAIIPALRVRVQQLEQANTELVHWLPGSLAGETEDAENTWPEFMGESERQEVSEL